MPQRGVRVVCLRTAANPDSRTIQDLAGATAAGMNITKEQVLDSLAESTMLKVSPLTQDTANVPVLLASDRARMMTGTVHNTTLECAQTSSGPALSCQNRGQVIPASRPGSHHLFQAECSRQTPLNSLTSA